MKNPGPFKAGDKDHAILILFNDMMARRFGVGDMAMLGQIVKFHDAACEAVETPLGFGSLMIECREYDSFIRVTREMFHKAYWDGSDFGEIWQELKKLSEGK